MQNRSYRNFYGKPLFGFGYGLINSSFSYSNHMVSSESVETGQSLTVQVDVRNTSEIAGDEVVELYIQYSQSVGAPIRALKGFSRVHLVPSETRHVTFTPDPRDLSLVTEKGEHVVEPGIYTVFVGGG